MPPPPAESRATTAGKWLLAVLIPASGLALGSLPLEVLMVMSAAAALSCGLLWGERDARTSRASRWVLVAMAVLLGWTILQAVPLPAGIVRLFSPANADIWERALSPLREAGPTWHTLSVAPGATRVEVLRGFFYGCVFVAALRVANLENGEHFLLRVVVFSTVLMAIAALAHMAVGADKVFGIYKPRDAHAYRVGRLAPLLNTNHLAAYLDIGACVALGSVVSGRSMPRALAASAALVLAGTSVWQGSRGAAGALMLGAVLTIALTLYTKRRFESTRVNAAVLAACAAGAAFMVSIALSEVAREHLVVTDVTKYDVAKSAVRLIRSSPWFGVGRGGFESVFSSVREGSSYVTFTHPEDGVVQWFVEWGMPVSVFAFVALCAALRPQVVFRAVRPAVGAWVAVVVAVLHDLVDYHFEVLGVVALAAVCVAVVVSARTSSRDSPRLRPTSSSRVPAVILATGTLLAIVFARPELDHSLAEERRTLSALAVDEGVSRDAFHARVRASLLRFPAEPFFPLMGAVRAQFADEDSVMPWVSRALERSPRFGRAHFVLARSLGPRYPAQARLEYRLAFEHDQQLRDQIVKEAVRLVTDPQSALEIVPDGDAGIEMLEALIHALSRRLPSTVAILDGEIARRSPTAIGPLRRRAEASVLDATDGAPWCTNKECITEGLATAEALRAREPRKCESHVLIARLHVASGDRLRAINDLERAADGVVERGACQRELITMALATDQARRADAALDKLVRGGCGAAAECTDIYTWAAGIEESRAHHARAVRLYKRVLEIAPDRDDLLQRIGALGENTGVRADAIEAYEILKTRHPEDPRWPARISELRNAAVPPGPAGSVLAAPRPLP